MPVLTAANEMDYHRLDRSVARSLEAAPAERLSAVGIATMMSDQTTTGF
ncbi:hypothetical protein I545_3993 [Mycobacterium kansasii 662]|uniref:Uncharacterized protein n=2 Tax=Mycobacterium kansasii TaxID=1768 RepID=A0A1V3WHV5_MYCKA|nr:hypothetical protein I547_6204 [Mycobacterium kansasii 824]EUA17041.1 hypothetical protein I545_3993 [Mycobacterium kansasii 662]OOK66557.1 hypothetical protein BZL30_8049 [Mycobacterium kansasii]